MLQRSAIAMALLTSPDLLILDEPTTALDVTTQAMVLDLLDELKAEFSSAILYITHNLGVVARICDRVAIMYAGEIFEEATTAGLFGQPLHPYTLNLLNCVPRFGATGREDAGGEDAGGEDARPKDDAADGSAAADRGGRLATIAGALPRLDHLPVGCVFAPRCPLALDTCRVSRPPLTGVTARAFYFVLEMGDAPFPGGAAGGSSAAGACGARGRGNGQQAGGVAAADDSSDGAGATGRQRRRRSPARGRGPLRGGEPR